MIDGKFTPEEKQYLASLPAVDYVTDTKIFYNNAFQISCIARYYTGEKPQNIFESAGLYTSMIGYKRVERAFARWKENHAKDRMTQIVSGHIPDPTHVKQSRQGRKRMNNPETAHERVLREKNETIAYQARQIEKLRIEVEALKELRRLEIKLAAKDKTLSKSDKFALIHTLTHTLAHARVTHLCTLLNVSKSGYYKWEASKPIRERKHRHDQWLRGLVEKAFHARGFFKGSRQIRDWIRIHFNIRINRKCVQRIMRAYNIRYPVKRKRPYQGLHADGQPTVAANILARQFFPGMIDTVFVTDITYIPTRQGWLYLSAIKDCQSSRIVAWKTSTSLKLDFVINCLDQLKTHGFAPGAIIHSDQGAHYTSHQYHTMVKTMGLTQSMSRKGNCHDNACIESWFARLKTEIGDTHTYSIEHATQRVNEYIDYYNTDRVQKRLGYKTPQEYTTTFTKQEAC